MISKPSWVFLDEIASYFAWLPPIRYVISQTTSFQKSSTVCCLGVEIQAIFHSRRHKLKIQDLSLVSQLKFHPSCSLAAEGVWMTLHPLLKTPSPKQGRELLSNFPQTWMSPLAEAGKPLPKTTNSSPNQPPPIL